MQYDINKEVAKVSTLSSGKIDKYQYLTGEETFPANQRKIIEQTNFTYSPLAKALAKQTKIDRRTREKTNRWYYESKK